MAHLVDELDLPAFDFFAWDARGHGLSPGQRGHSPGFANSVRDVQTFVDHIHREHGLTPQDMHIVAQSVGAVLIATWAHDYAPAVRGLTLASPAFKVKLYVPFARMGLTLMHKLRGLFFVNSYVKARLLTHDTTRIQSFESDPLIARPIAVNVLLDLYRAAERVVADANAIVQPTQLLISGADWVVHRAPQKRFFERLGSAVKEKIELPGFFHDTLGERDRAPVVAAVRAFVLKLFDQAPAPVCLRDADKHGATATEARQLAAPLPLVSPRGAYWAMTRTGLRLGSRISEGLRVGQTTGFDSGSMLDYVYRDTSSGFTPLGRFVDRQYLNAIGWRGIRQRKRHLEELLLDAIQRTHASAAPVHVMDVAAGHGRYLLDAVKRVEVPVASLLLRDYSPLNVSEGRALIREMGLEHVARFEQADAFDRKQVGSVAPRPNVAVVSGLYELFPSNELVSRSLAGISDAVPQSGYLIYTGQPWHPQLEMIARALTSHRQGQAWVMRRRTQAEMDQLVREAGFRKLTQRIDEWGIFTVSLAIREA